MSEDINSETENEPSQIRHQTPSDTDVVDDTLTAEAKEALAALDANSKDHIGLMLRLCEEQRGTKLARTAPAMIPPWRKRADSRLSSKK
jgi:hypothetical protein